MKRPLTPSLSPSDGERVAGGRVRGWFMVPLHAKDETALSMNRPLTPSLSPSEGERVPDLSAEGLAKVEERVRGGGPWSQFASKRERRPPLNRVAADVSPRTLESSGATSQRDFPSSLVFCFRSRPRQRNWSRWRNSACASRRGFASRSTPTPIWPTISTR